MGAMTSSVPRLGLVHAGEHHPEDDEYPHGLVQDAVKEGQQRYFATESLGQNRDEFDPQHRHVDHDAHGHFKEGRVVVLEDKHLPDGPGASDVDKHGNGHESVAQRSREQGGPGNGFVVVSAQYVGEEGGGETACSQGNAGSNVQADPDAPGVMVVKVGYGAQPVGVAEQQGDCRPEHEGEHDQGSGGPERSRDRLRFMTHGHPPCREFVLYSP